MTSGPESPGPSESSAGALSRSRVGSLMVCGAEGAGVFASTDRDALGVGVGVGVGPGGGGGAAADGVADEIGVGVTAVAEVSRGSIDGSQVCAGSGRARTSPASCERTFPANATVPITATAAAPIAIARYGLRRTGGGAG
ncbi:hypothetical protein [Streptomyces sp. NPDC051662]|uniref:hypothetical protein n=1 Tax=Streptomyces sp. NPDC051662 TaxID=3154750 RepID=UPI00342A9453